MKQGWEIKKLGEVCKIMNGGTPDTKIPEFWDGDNLWITPKDMGKLSTRYVMETERSITDDGLKNSSAKILPVDSVILSSRAPIGHLAINKKPISTNQGCKGLIPYKGLNTLYLYYFLSNSIELLNNLGSGTTFKELSWAKLSEVEIPICHFSEQERIVGILDSAFAKIEALRANAYQNLQNTKDLFQTSLKQELTPKQGWKQIVLPDISTNLDNKRVPITKGIRTNGVYPYYGASGIVDYVDGYIFDEELLLISEDGANLLARSTPIAFSVAGKIWVNNHAHVIKFTNINTQKYIEYHFASIKIDEYVTGAAQPKLNQKALNSILIDIPIKVLEQQSIVEKLDALSERCRAMEENYRQTIAHCNALKQALLTKAFNGEL